MSGETGGKGQPGEKIVKPSAVDLVFEKMKEAIKDGTWPLGTKIPSESDLADTYGVNRLTIRMALQKLNVLGLVQTRHGEGTFVRRFQFSDYVRQVSEFYDDDMFADIADFRTAVELSCCRLAMERATQPELRRLERLLEKNRDANDMIHKEYVEEDFLRVVDTDLAFHEYICQISHNSLLYAAFLMARDAIYQHLLMIVKKRLDRRRERMAEAEGPVMGRATHEAIYKAIVARDFEACKQAYMDMVDHRVDLYGV